MEPILQILDHLIPKKGSWVLSLKSVHCPNLTVHTSNRSQVFNTLRGLHHFGCMQQLLPIISSICNKYQSYGQYDFPQHIEIAKCLFVNITRPPHYSCFLQVFVGHNCQCGLCYVKVQAPFSEYRHLCMTQPKFIGHPALLGSPSAKFDTTPKTCFHCNNRV